MDPRLLNDLFSISEQIICVVSNGQITAVNVQGKLAGISAGTPIGELLDVPVPEIADNAASEFRAKLLGRLYRVKALRRESEILLSFYPVKDDFEVPNTLIHTAGTIRRSLQDLNIALDVLSDRMNLDDAVTGSHAALAMRSVFQLQRTAIQLDLYHKLRTGDYKLNRRTCEINALLFQLADTAKNLLMSTGVRFERDLPKTQIHGYLDWDLVELLLWELLGNAVAHSSGKLLRLTVRQTDESQLVFTVSNSSTDELPDDVYDRHSVPPEESSGTLGLGLSVARLGAVCHGGNLLLSQGPDGRVRAVLSIHMADKPDQLSISQTPTAFSQFPLSLVCLSTVLPTENYDLRDLV